MDNGFKQQSEAQSPSPLPHHRVTALPSPRQRPEPLPATKLDTGVCGDGCSLHGEGPPDLFSGSSPTQTIFFFLHR